MYGAIAGGGAVVGLLLGGALTEWLSWRWCLYVNLVFAVVAVAGVLAFVAVRDDRGSVLRLDWPGIIAGSGGLFCLVYGLSNAETDSWSASLTIAMFVLSALLLTAFAVIEARAAAPLLPLQIVMDRNRIGAYLAIMVSFCSMFSVFLFLTYYAQQNLGYSPLKTGVAFLPLSVGIAVSAGAANARLIPRLGPRRVVPSGMLIAAGGMFWLPPGYSLHLCERCAWGPSDPGRRHRPDFRTGDRHRHRRHYRRGRRRRLGNGEHHPADRWCNRDSRALNDFRVSPDPLYD